MFRQLQLDQVNIYSFSLIIVAQVGLIDNVLILKKISEVKIGGNFCHFQAKGQMPNLAWRALLSVSARRPPPAGPI